MSRKHRNRERKPARRKPFRQPKPLILIVQVFICSQNRSEVID